MKVQELNPIEKILFDKGFEIGKSAFRAGLIDIPVKDPILNSELERIPSSYSSYRLTLTLLEGWLRGYGEENLISDW